MYRYAILHAADPETLDRHEMVYINPVYVVKVYRRHTRRHEEITRPLYPGYMFLREDYVPRFFAQVRSGRMLATDGVIHYVKEDAIVAVPQALPPEDLGPAPVKGDSVRIRSGPFAGILAVVEVVDGDFVMISTPLGKLKLPAGLCEVLVS